MVLLYKILAGLDWIVYWLASAAFRVVFEISQREFFKPDQITEVANRVYVILGVLMLFKVVISAIQYLVNPDSFGDKDKGFAGLLKKVVITFALIAVTPTLFDFAKSVEATILNQLPSIVLGTDAPEVTGDDNIGNRISYTVLSSFVRLRKTDKGGSVGAYGSGAQIHDLDSFVAHVTDGCPYGVGLIFGSQDDCVYDYMIIVSTASGIFLCYVLLSMTLDIAIRAIKFGIIQMLAPIPISSYVFSKDKLSKFGKTALQVYTDLFIRLIIVYFVIFAIQSLIKAGTINIFDGHGSTNVGEWFLNVLINVAMIFGLLMFAKKAPKFITDLLGLPEVTGGDMADMFKPAWQRIGGLSSPGAAIGAYRNAIEYGEKPGRAVRRALTAGGHAVAARLKDVAAGKDLAESYKTSKEAAMARTNRNLEYANRYPNSRERRRLKLQEKIDAYTGVTTGGKKASNTIATANATIDMRKHAWDRANAKSIEHRDRYESSPISTRYNETLDDGSVVSRNVTYDWIKAEQRYSQIQSGQKELFAGEYAWLESNIQNMRDAASKEYIRQAFVDKQDASGKGTGDAETRNVFAEDIYKIIRSGADSDVVNKIVFQSTKIRVIDTDAKGNLRIDPVTKEPIYKIGADGKPVMKDITVNLIELAKKVRDGVQMSYDEAEALSNILPTMNKVGGNIRVEATATQTSEPKSS